MQRQSHQGRRRLGAHRDRSSGVCKWNCRAHGWEVRGLSLVYRESGRKLVYRERGRKLVQREREREDRERCSVRVCVRESTARPPTILGSAHRPVEPPRNPLQRAHVAHVALRPLHSHRFCGSPLVMQPGAPHGKAALLTCERRIRQGRAALHLPVTATRAGRTPRGGGTPAASRLHVGTSEQMHRSQRASCPAPP